VHISTFATGVPIKASQPDSIAFSPNSVWIEYGNGACSTGCGGRSTIVQYDLNGKIQHKYSIHGSVDGLKLDPITKLMWALQNQDGNSTLTLINPVTDTVSQPIPYAFKSSTRGYDDVAFRLNQAFLSYTNPVGPKDPIIQLVENVSDPIVVTNILFRGTKGFNLATGQVNQPTSANDPDSLKLTPFGDLMLTSGDDGQLLFVSNPGTRFQFLSFLTLLDPRTGKAVSGLDDAVFATTTRGIFYLTDTGNNRVLKIDVEDVPIGTLFACVGSLNQLVVVDLHTGITKPVVSNLNGPHGLEFVPQHARQW
jgi:hypothetical protein